MKLSSFGVFLTLIVSFVFLVSLVNGEIYGQLVTNATSVESNQTQQPTQSQLQPFTIPRNNDNQEVTAPSSSSTGPQSSAGNNIEDNPNDDIVLLSQRYNNERFGDEIVGEVLNNGSSTAEYVKVSASFYDKNGAILGSQFTYADPSTIRPGDRAAFTIHISSDAIEDDTEKYEFTIQWNDDDFNQFSNRITGTAADGHDNDNNDNDNNDNDNNDNDNNDNDNNDNDNNDNDNNDNGNALDRLNDLFNN